MQRTYTISWKKPGEYSSVKLFTNVTIKNEHILVQYKDSHPNDENDDVKFKKNDIQTTKMQTKIRVGYLFNGLMMVVFVGFISFIGLSGEMDFTLALGIFILSIFGFYDSLKKITYKQICIILKNNQSVLINGTERDMMNLIIREIS